MYHRALERKRGQTSPQTVEDSFHPVAWGSLVDSNRLDEQGNTTTSLWELLRRDRSTRADDLEIKLRRVRYSKVRASLPQHRNRRHFKEGGQKKREPCSALIARRRVSRDLVEPDGFEPTTLRLQSECSPS
jgi:hypothetical protein